MIQSIIQSIGAHAISEKEPLLILFDETATQALQEYSVIQKIEADTKFDVKPGGTIRFDDQEYTIQHVGRLANQNLNSIGHVTLVFKEHETADRIVNGIYLEPYTLPTIRMGTQITYQ